MQLPFAQVWGRFTQKKAPGEVATPWGLGILGAFTSLENAKSACKAGYTVYDDNGKAVYTAAGQQASAGVPFSVQVDILDLNIRTGAGTNYAKTGETTGKGVFTIVEVKAGQGASVGWGRLKSGAGWISLDYATRLA